MRKLLLVALMGMLLAASIAPIADPLCEAVESRYPPVAPVDMSAADAILVLGGGLGTTVPPRVIPQLHLGGSRAWYGARLWKAGKAPVIVAVGGGEGIPESAAIAEFLMDLGVAPDAILQESASRSTVENALFVKTLLTNHQIRRSLLVTSSLHMPRALAIFQAAGIDVIPASADAEVVRERAYGFRDFLPSPEALFRTSRVVKELVGARVYPIQFRMHPYNQPQPQP